MERDVYITVTTYRHAQEVRSSYMQSSSETGIKGRVTEFIGHLTGQKEREQALIAQIEAAENHPDLLDLKKKLRNGDPKLQATIDAALQAGKEFRGAR
jgi:hypothetical protein